MGGRSVTRDSIFRIASTTKPITAAATLAVAAEGLIGLDKPVDRLLPELADRRVLRRMDGPLDDTAPTARAITVRDLLTFTFGFGMVAEMFASPQPWPVVAATDELRLATAYQPTPDGLVVLDEPAGKWSRPPEFGDGAAGLVSTADDLLAFARMLLRGGAPVLPPDAVRAMTTDQLTPAQKTRGGFCQGSSRAGRGGSARRSTTAARSAGTADWARPGWLTRPRT